MSEMQTYFRVQPGDRDVNDLLDPGHQFSHAWNGGRTCVGVSTCEDLEDLALYLASHLGNGIPVREDSWVIVELQGEAIPDARPVDPEFETLIRPTAIVGVRPVDAAFMAMIKKSEEFLASFDDGPLFDDDSNEEE